MYVRFNDYLNVMGAEKWPDCYVIALRSSLSIFYFRRVTGRGRDGPGGDDPGDLSEVRLRGGGSGGHYNVMLIFQSHHKKPDSLQGVPDQSGECEGESPW